MSKNQSNEIYQLQKQFTRLSSCETTLVFEMVGTFVQLIDPVKDQVDTLFSDGNIHQFQCCVEGSTYFALLKYQPIDLIKQLRKLAKRYELVIYTILPREIVKNFLH